MQRSAWAAFGGHLWTVLPSLRHLAWRQAGPPAAEWRSSVVDADGRVVGLSGRVSSHHGSDTALVIVHGLGGSADSHYCLRAARAASRRGWTSLRLNLRGADGSGEDLYHAGLTADLEDALASVELAGCRRLFVLGYSLGGHVALQAARSRRGARLTAVAAVCAPLDLDCGARALDAPRAWLYRRHILAGLRATYARYAARHPQATPVARVRRARTMRAFDSLTVVPRFGFADADDYYRSQSVGPHLASITLPALLVYARHDPIVSPETVAGHVARLGSAASVWWLERAGHVGFPERIAVDGQSPARLEDRILDWLDAHSGRD